MSVLLCDSNCELWYTRLAELGIDYIAMPYTLEGKEYFYDLGKETDFAYFYKSVRGGAMPITSALNPENYKEILKKYFDDGEDVLYVSFSHAMSGTFDQLDKALSELMPSYSPPRNCTVFDTKSISLGAGIQVEKAGELKLAGKTDKEIVCELEKFTDEIAVYFVVDDLMHLKRGGRLSAAAAFAGTLLGLKPVLTFDENGGLTVLSKISGKRKALKYLAEKVTQDLTEPDKYSVYVVDADCPADGDYLKDLILEKRPEARIVRQIVGPVIGTHCGPGTVGVIFKADKRPIPLKRGSNVSKE